MGEKLALSRFRLGPSIFLKIRTIFNMNFTKSAHGDLTGVNPSLVLTRARLHFQYGAGNCKKVYCSRCKRCPFGKILCLALNFCLIFRLLYLKKSKQPTRRLSPQL